MSVCERVRELFDRRGDSEYGNEAVSQLQHALQCATLAECDGAPPPLIVAALLHDIGHLLHDLPDDAPEHGIDDHHEHSGYRFVRTHFDDDVAEPVRQHVAAKRYLVTVDPDYASTLSPPSVQSLQLQGGAMSTEEVAAFQTSPHWTASVALRKWDDRAKDVDMTTPNLGHFLQYVDQVAVSIL